MQRLQNLGVSYANVHAYRLQPRVLSAVEPQLGELEVGLGGQALTVSFMSSPISKLTSFLASSQATRVAS